MGLARRSNFEDFVIKATAIHGDKYSYKYVDYIDSQTKVVIVCNEHGAFMQSPSSHLSGSGCPLCGLETMKQKNRYSQEEILKRFKEVHGDEYDYSKVEYKGLQVKVAIICKEHGVFYQTPSAHIHMGCGCPICANIKVGLLGRQTKEEFIEMARKVHGDKYDYSLVEEDKLSSEKVSIICPEHGVFLQNKKNHLRGSGCPHCPKSCISLGEKKVSEILDQMGIEYIQQHKIVNENLFCKNKTLLADFYLPKYNTIIEYNGQQHYEIEFYFGGEERLERQQERDMALRQYCKEHKIKLIEIPYWNYDNIETIIMKELKENEPIYIDGCNSNN